ncbi:hypothetical protein [Streptomonospora wellingtoniae]|uniref:DUF4177 domain-containing protein n=1 Tax=Streptomonospora wellingtoniae TaxID=3075544 RepID=A0ABU2L0G0_9ACTN|nr:hypothetical protein [Streptomonospora sp. DSM 45055]MDT0305045.1 hypothetical protein [Streptomonospora sp. DSM 45055]
MQRWEYRVEEHEYGLSQGRLDSLGRSGWELVSEVVLPDERRGPKIRAVLKRPTD